MVCGELVQYFSDFLPVDSYCSMTVGLIISTDVILDYNWVCILHASGTESVRHVLLLKIGCSTAVNVGCLHKDQRNLILDSQLSQQVLDVLNDQAELLVSINDHSLLCILLLIEVNKTISISIKGGTL